MDIEHRWISRTRAGDTLAGVPILTLAEWTSRTRAGDIDGR